MKVILISIKPQHVANILNRDKTIEIRKKFPKDYVGWVYIYCTKDKLSLAEYLYKDGWVYDAVLNYDYAKSIGCAKEKLNGKVVARFNATAEEIACEQLDNGVGKNTFFYTDNICDITKDSCLSTQDLINYLGAKSNGEIVGTAIHINDLEIFDKPKELALHTHDNNAIFYTRKWDKKSKCWRIGALTRAPQSYCFIEIGE